MARALGLNAQQLLDSFAPATAMHLDDVVALRRSLMGEAIYWDDAAYLRWRYCFGSPVAGRGDCWVLLLAGRLAGMVGTEQIDLLLNGHTTAAWATMDIAVDPRYEGSGLGSWMNLRICAASGCALTIGSNQKSRNMITRTFRRLPDRRSYVLPIRFGRIMEKRIGVLALARMASWSADRLSSLWRRWALSSNSGQLEFRPISRFDSSISDLLERAVDTQERQIARSAGYLNWRLFDNPRLSYSVTGAYEHGVLVGYLATMSRGSRGGSSSVVLVDWMVDQNRFTPIFKALCANSVQAAARLGADLVSVTAYHVPTERLLRRLGFIPRFNGYETIAVFATNHTLLEELLGPTTWFITEANADRDNL